MRTDLELDVGALRFDERGLIPAVVQDLRSRKVLTLAYMNRESLEITLREGRTCFYSRSRGTLWRKGETSRNEGSGAVVADRSGHNRHGRLTSTDDGQDPVFISK